MTPEEWACCPDPIEMVRHLQGKASDRKLRLFACACCRQVWEDDWPHRTRRAVETAERFADGHATLTDLNRARSGACSAAQGAALPGRRNVPGPPRQGRRRRLFFAAEAAHPHEPFLIGRLQGFGWDEEVRWVAPTLLRCVFAAPHRAPTRAEAWRTPDVLAVARAAYEERALPAGLLDAQRLAVLADALEEQGCADEGLLGHLREPGPHVRGCWPLDAVLAKG
jgi:hypothetical protein